MGSICHDLAVSRLRPFCSTIVVFSDYTKPPIRHSSIMEVPAIRLFKHDPIDACEDGPTHQPIEQMPALRSIPGLLTLRPCDANETLEMYKHITKLQHEPAAVVLSRRLLPTLDRTKYGSAARLRKGGYTLIDCGEKPELILIATGSEVKLMLEASTVMLMRDTDARARRKETDSDSDAPTW